MTDKPKTISELVNRLRDGVIYRYPGSGSNDSATEQVMDEAADFIEKAEKVLDELFTRGYNEKLVYEARQLLNFTDEDKE